MKKLLSVLLLFSMLLSCLLLAGCHGRLVTPEELAAGGEAPEFSLLCAVPCALAERMFPALSYVKV